MYIFFQTSIQLSLSIFHQWTSNDMTLCKTGAASQFKESDFSRTEGTMETITEYIYCMNKDNYTGVRDVSDVARCY